MTKCGNGEIWRNGQCELTGATATYTYSVTLLLGVGAIAVGIYLRQRGRQAPPAPVVQGPDRHGLWATDTIIAKVAPFFLIVCGCAFVLATIITLIDQ